MTYLLSPKQRNLIFEHQEGRVQLNQQQVEKRKLEIISGVRKRMRGGFVRMEQFIKEYDEVQTFIKRNRNELYSQSLEFDILGNEGSQLD